MAFLTFLFPAGLANSFSLGVSLPLIAGKGTAAIAALSLESIMQEIVSLLRGSISLFTFYFAVVNFNAAVVNFTAVTFLL